MDRKTLRIVREETEYYRPYVEAIDEVQFILDLDDEEVGDFNEWGDVERIRMIQEAIAEFKRETNATHH